MALKYKDAVVLVRKSRDADGIDAVSRVNAIVLASATQPPNAHTRGALKNHKGVLPHGEYLDLTFPTELPEGQVLTSRSADHIFRFAYAVPEWDGYGNIGWEPATAELHKRFNDAFAAVADERDRLRAQLAAVADERDRIRAQLAAVQQPAEPQGDAVQQPAEPQGDAEPPIE